VTTHENSTTMSLYGYGLVQYVVEPSLAYQSVVRIEWTLLGSVWLGMRGVREWTLLRTTWHKRGPLVIWTDTSGETSAGTRQTRENQ
jgi:hypothetical protein